MPPPNFHWHLLPGSLVPGDALWRSLPNTWAQAVVDTRYMLNPVTLAYEYVPSVSPEDTGANAARCVQNLYNQLSADYAFAGKTFRYQLNFVGLGQGVGSTPRRIQPNYERFPTDLAPFNGDNFQSLFYQESLRVLAAWASRMSARFKRELASRSLPSPIHVVCDIEERGDISTNGFGFQSYSNGTTDRSTGPASNGGMVEISLTDPRAAPGSPGDEAVYTRRAWPTMVRQSNGTLRPGDRVYLRDLWNGMTDRATGQPISAVYATTPPGRINERNPANAKWSDVSRAMQNLRYAGLLCDGVARFLRRDFANVPFGEWQLFTYAPDAPFMAHPGMVLQNMNGRFPLEIQVPAWYLGYGFDAVWSLEVEAGNAAPAGAWGTIPNWIAAMGQGGSTPNEQFRRASIAWSKQVIRNCVRAAPYTKVNPSISALGNNPFKIASEQYQRIADFRNYQRVYVPDTATGSFRLTYKGVTGGAVVTETTADISVTATTAAVQAALEAVMGAGNVLVYGTPMIPAGTVNGQGEAINRQGVYRIVTAGSLHLVSIRAFEIVNTGVSGGTVVGDTVTYSTGGGYYYQITPEDIAEVVIDAAQVGVTDWYVFQDQLTASQSQFWRDTIAIVNAALP